MIAVRRRYWQCRCGEPGGYLADALLGIDGRYSRVVQTHACRLAADTSFAAAGEHLRAMLAVRVSAETIRTVVEGHGRAMARFQPTDAATEAAFAATPGEVELAVDAGKVCTRQDGWKDPKIAVISRRIAGEPATPDEWHERSLPAAGMVLAFAMIATAKTFGRSWRPRLRRLGVTAFAAVHAVGDGAKWIRKAVDRCRTGCRQTLDVYHACEHLSTCAERIFGEGTEEKRAAFERGRGLLLSGGWSGVGGGTAGGGRRGRAGAAAAGDGEGDAVLRGARGAAGLRRQPGRRSGDRERGGGGAGEDARPAAEAARGAVGPAERAAAGGAGGRPPLGPVAIALGLPRRLTPRESGYTQDPRAIPLFALAG